MDAIYLMRMGKVTGGTDPASTGELGRGGHKNDWDYLCAEAGDLPRGELESVLNDLNCIADWNGAADPKYRWDRRETGFVETAPNPNTTLCHALTEHGRSGFQPCDENQTVAMMEGSGGASILTC